MILNIQGQNFQQLKTVRRFDIDSSVSFDGGIQKIRNGMSTKPAKFGIAGMVLYLLMGIFAPKSKALSLTSHPQAPIVEEITQKSIAIVDCFEKKSIDLDGDKKPDVSHGGMLRRILGAFLPGYSVDVYDVSSSKSNENFSDQKLFDELNNIVKKIADGVKYEAVNISLSLNTSYKALSEGLKTKITPENVGNNQELIRKEFINDGGRSIQLIEKIIELGVPVYISSGNKASYYDVLNAARGAISVGALNKDGQTMDSLANNSDVDRYLKSELKVMPVIGEGVLNGFDIDSDGRVDIKASELSSKGNVKKVSSMTIMGTSIATLLAIKEDLEKKND